MSKVLCTRFISLLVVLLLSFSLMGCDKSKSESPSGNAQPGAIVDLSIATASTGGTGFMYGTAVAKVINEKVPGFSAKSIASAGVVENDRLLRSGEADIIIALPITAYESYTGKGNFAKIFSKIGPYKDIRSLWWMYGSFVQAIVPADSNIKSFADLKGKKVGVGMPGSTAYISAVGILEAYGVKLDQIQSQQMSVDEMTTGMKDGTIDAMITIMGADTPQIKELANVRKVRWLNIDKDKYDSFASKWPSGSWILGKIPANSFEGQTEEVPTVVGPLLLATNTKLSTEQVYNITKAFFENLETAYQVHPVVRETTKDFSFATSPPVPWHDGVIKYLEEKGIKYEKYEGQ